MSRRAPTHLDHAASAARKTFADGTRALEPLDLDDRRPARRVVLLGPSGCGKTTTLRIIAGLEQPDAGGRVLFDGADVTPLPIEKRNVGMVFQSYALFPNMNVAEQHRLRPEDPQARASRDRRPRCARCWRMMRIEALADRQIDQLSGGQRQRVALARALAVAAARAAARRAADGARRQAARCAAARDRPAAAPPRHHHHLRHPRPGRGDGAGRPHRGDGARAASHRSAGRATSTSGRRRASSPSSSAP